MGSLDKYCRLCAANVRPEQLLRLYEVRIARFCWVMIIFDRCLISGWRCWRDESLCQAEELPEHGAEPWGQVSDHI